MLLANTINTVLKTAKRAMKDEAWRSKFHLERNDELC